MDTIKKRLRNVFVIVTCVSRTAIPNRIALFAWHKTGHYFLRETRDGLNGENERAQGMSSNRTLPC